MNIKLVFDKTGDELAFRAINCEVVEFFIDNLNQRNYNKFYSNNNNFVVPEVVQRLECVVKDLALHFNKYYEIPLKNSYEYLDQNVLNELHWSFVKFSKLINQYKIDIDINVKSKLQEMNHLIHAIESRFKNFDYKTISSVYINHTFDKTKILYAWPANLVMTYNLLGRSLFDKFETFDIDNKFDDENTFDQLVGRINFNLQRIETHDFSLEYLDWCKKRNKVPLGKYLNLGIIDDLPNKICSYRQIITRNVIDKNTFSIHKG